MAEEKVDSILSAARQLAVAGQHEAALAILGDDEQLDVEGLLLKGKILAQLYRYEEAIRTWKAVLLQDENNRAAKAAIGRAERAAQPLAGTFFRYSAGLWTATALAIAIVVFLGSSLVSADRNTSEDPQPVSDGQKSQPEKTNDNPSKGLIERVEELSKTVEALAQRVDKAPASPPETKSVDLSPLQNEIAELKAQNQASQAQVDKLQAEVAELSKVKQEPANEKPPAVEPKQNDEELQRLGTRVEELSQELIDNRKQQLAWRIDVLVERERGLLRQGSNPQRQQLINSIESHIKDLEELPLEENWKAYAQQMKGWIETKRQGR